MGLRIPKPPKLDGHGAPLKRRRELRALLEPSIGADTGVAVDEEQSEWSHRQLVAVWWALVEASGGIAPDEQPSERTLTALVHFLWACERKSSLDGGGGSPERNYLSPEDLAGR